MSEIEILQKEKKELLTQIAILRKEIERCWWKINYLQEKLDKHENNSK